MKKAVLSIAVVAVVALAVVFQIQSVRAQAAAAVSPGKPSNVSAEYQGERSISVSWHASPRERTGILYEVFYRRSGASTWTPVAVGYSGTPGVSYSTHDPIVVPTLGKYQVRVKACNYYSGTDKLCNNRTRINTRFSGAPKTLLWAIPSLPRLPALLSRSTNTAIGLFAWRHVTMPDAASLYLEP